MEEMKVSHSEEIQLLLKQLKKLQNGIEYIEIRLKELKDLCSKSQENADDFIRH